jgi:hypothetical protein
LSPAGPREPISGSTLDDTARPASSNSRAVFGWRTPLILGSRVDARLWVRCAEPSGLRSRLKGLPVDCLADTARMRYVVLLWQGELLKTCWKHF